MFNIQGFYNDLFKSAESTLLHITKLWDFVRRLHSNGKSDNQRTLLKGLQPNTADVLSSLPELAELEKQGPLEKQFVADAKAVMTGNAAASLEMDRDKLMTDKLASALAASEKSSTKTSLTSGPAARAADRRAMLRDLLGEIAETTRRLRERVQFLNNVRKTQVGTLPGFGRIDAFGTARNLLFGKSDKTNAPVSYPFLWGFATLTDLHYDDNTNSVLERNIGQSMGLGSTPSTVEIRKIHRLESLAGKIVSPKWPSAFPPIDRDKAASGAATYEAKCHACHAAPGKVDSSVGTDDGRLRSFNAKVDGQPFAAKLAAELTKVKQQGFARENVTADEQEAFDGNRTPYWRSTTAYAPRTLSGSWATAPYLHNGSVASLAALLKLRPRLGKICVGGTFDPVAVGYSETGCEQRRQLDVAEVGNGNGGHAYGTELTDPEKEALIEYLKTL